MYKLHNVYTFLFFIRFLYTVFKQHDIDMPNKNQPPARRTCSAIPHKKMINKEMKYILT